MNLLLTTYSTCIPLYACYSGLDYFIAVTHSVTALNVITCLRNICYYILSSMYLGCIYDIVDYFETTLLKSFAP